MITTKNNSTTKKNKEDIKDKNILYILDGNKLSGYDDIKKISPKDIASIEVIKDSNSFSLYSNDKNLEGIIIITTNQQIVKKYREIFTQISKDYKLLIDTIDISEDHKKLNYILNDTLLLPEVDYNKLDSISKLDNLNIRIGTKSSNNAKVDVYIKTK